VSNRSRWWVALILALPFLVMIAVLRGMTVALPIFHGTDEVVYQYPTILQFSHELPFPDLHSYKAAQTPLFHILFAYIGKVIGYQLWRLRLVQVLISYGLVLAVYRLLRARVRLPVSQALILALLFELSPYVFGQSFRLVTDNLALLFTVLALERFEAFRETSRPAPFVVGCVLTAAAILTRQSTAFMVGVAVLYALRPGWRAGGASRAGLVVVALLSAVPAGLLFLNWHGLVPVGGDPSSCGLCVARGAGSGLSTGGLEVQTAELALATIGLYGTILLAPVATRAIFTRWVAVGIVAGLVLLLVFHATPGAHAAGTIWKIAEKLPTIDGSSLAFWLLVPLAGAVLGWRLPLAPRPWLTGALALTFVVSTVAIRFPWQKYTDPLALLVVLVTVRAGELNRRRQLVGAAILALLFIAYTADYSSHGKALPPPAPHAVTAIVRSPA
jgi:Dolichyl-phosphate-mannose-protein mannosyltransferase